MATKVDTFEHDIADEIRRKEASLAEIEAVSKQNSPNPVPAPARKLPILTIVLSILLVLSLLGVTGVAYYYFSDSLLPPSAKEERVTKNDVPKVTADLTKLSPVLGTEVGRYVTHVEKRETGYILSINNYSAVFGFMIRNENSYINDLALLFPQAAVSTSTQQTRLSSGSSTPVSTEPITSSTSKTITKNKTSSTTSEQIVTQQEVKPLTNFTDITLSNQNMRVYTNGSTTVIYAFAGTKAVLISNTPEGILALKSAILH